MRSGGDSSLRISVYFLLGNPSNLANPRFVLLVDLEIKRVEEVPGCGDFVSVIVGGDRVIFEFLAVPKNESVPGRAADKEDGLKSVAG